MSESALTHLDFDFDLYLASRSPRRRELLGQIGLTFSLLDVSIDETPRAGELPTDYVLRMAVEKAQAGTAQLVNAGQRPSVLAADTAVIVDTDILGKPVDSGDAVAQLLRLSGRCHDVMTAVAIQQAEGPVRTVCVSSQVWFRQLSHEECVRYCASGEPLDKAGSYAIQGLAAVFIQRLEGSYSGVMGLPLFETGQLLEECGTTLIC